MFYTAYEPKLQNRFIFYIDGIPAYHIKTADKPKYKPGGKGFFATIGVKGFPPQQMDSEVSTPGAFSSSEPVERRNPSDLIPVGVHVDTPKSLPKLETVVENKKKEELPEADWNEINGPSQDSSDKVDPNMPPLSDIASDDDSKSALGETLEPEKQECENCGK